jgi:hypothetical protein
MGPIGTASGQERKAVRPCFICFLRSPTRLDSCRRMSVIGGREENICSQRIFRRLTSRPEDFHLRALPEPYVNLSIHTAPDVRPLP